MSNHSFFMPTKIFIGSPVNFKNEFIGLGNHAFIVTGKSSAKNGSLSDVLNLLNELNINHTIFDEVEENPTLENVNAAAKAGEGKACDFVIAIGGGSPMDASKAIAILLANTDKRCEDLFGLQSISSLPIVAIPTTAGTGSETTPFAVLTHHEKKTKISIPIPVFATKTFLCADYMEGMPDNVTLSTAVDVISHVIEGYLATNANVITDMLVEPTVKLFAQCIPALTSRKFTKEIREKLIVASTMAGMIIAQTKTTLPHQLGYALTYYKGLPHGFACGVFMHEFLKLNKNEQKVNNVINWLGFNNLTEVKAFFDDVITSKPKVTLEEVDEYVSVLMEMPSRLANYPFGVTDKELVEMYVGSLGV